jgi:hypothetical protein
MTITAAERLLEAEEQFHRFQLGQASIEVEVDGRRVRFNRTNIDDLEGYIARLKDEVACRRPRNGAIGFTF